MPVYDYKCSRCGAEIEAVQQMGNRPPVCCGEEMDRKYTSPPMIKMKGEGGYPSRRKQVFNTTVRKHPRLK